MHILIAALGRSSRPAGICRYAANLARCLANCERIEQVTLVVGKWQSAYFETCFDLRHDKLRVITPSIRNGVVQRNAWYAFALARLAERCGADLVHVALPMPLLSQRFPMP